MLGTWASVAAVARFWSTGSVVVAHRLSCLQHGGLSPRLLRWQVDSLPLSYQGSPRDTLFFTKHNAAGVLQAFA